MRCAAAALLAPWLAACDPTWDIRGTVTDCASAQPLAGATVALDVQAPSGPEGTETTDEAGSYRFNFVFPHDHPATLTFSAAGHAPKVLAFTEAPEKGEPLDVCLAPAP